MTVVTPSIVIEVSATFVLKMILRRSLGRRARSCSSAGNEPCNGSTTAPKRAAAGSRRLPTRRISANPGRKTSRWPEARASSDSCSSISGTICSASAGRFTGRYCTDTSCRSPVDPDNRAAVQIIRDLFGVERRRHHDQDQVRAHGLADLPQQGQRQVAIQVALVKLVEDDGTDIFQKRVGQELPSQNAFGQEAQIGLPRKAAFEANLEADFVSEDPALFLGDSARRWPAPRLALAAARSPMDTRPRAGPIARPPAARVSFFQTLGVRPAPVIDRRVDR